MNQVIYVKITDVAGNVGYVCSEGIRVETIIPVDKVDAKGQVKDEDQKASVLQETLKDVEEKASVTSESSQAMGMKSPKTGEDVNTFFWLFGGVMILGGVYYYSRIERKESETDC